MATITSPTLSPSAQLPLIAVFSALLKLREGDHRDANLKVEELNRMFAADIRDVEEVLDYLKTERTAAWKSLQSKLNQINDIKQKIKKLNTKNSDAQLLIEDKKMEITNLQDEKSKLQVNLHLSSSILSPYSSISFSLSISSPSSSMSSSSISLLLHHQ